MATAPSLPQSRPTKPLVALWVPKTRIQRFRIVVG
jgi:hypothetical protein